MSSIKDREAQRKLSPIQKLSGIGECQKQVGRPKTGREIKVKKTITVLPSIYDAATEIAKNERKAMSELIEELLQDYISSHK